MTNNSEFATSHYANEGTGQVLYSENNLPLRGGRLEFDADRTTG